MIRLKNVAIFEAHFEAAGRLAAWKWVGAKKIKIIRVFFEKIAFFENDIKM